MFSWQLEYYIVHVSPRAHGDVCLLTFLVKEAESAADAEANGGLGIASALREAIDNGVVSERAITLSDEHAWRHMMPHSSEHGGNLGHLRVRFGDDCRSRDCAECVSTIDAAKKVAYGWLAIAARTCQTTCGAPTAPPKPC